MFINGIIESNASDYATAKNNTEIQELFERY